MRGMSDLVSQITARRADILARLAKAAQDAGRSATDCQLVAVSKRQPDARIDAMLDAGQRVFGENRVQEAQDHWLARRERYPDLELRLIGPLQSNKAADAVALFDVIETIDRDKIAGAIAREIHRQDRHPQLYVQVNTGEEAQKAGVPPLELPAFLSRLREVHGLSVHGLMCIPPVDEPAGLHFALLEKLAREVGLPSLSMGMSGDFEIAIGLGASSVRVGSALFGERQT